MTLTQHIEEVQPQLAVAAEAGGDDARAPAERLTLTLDSVLHPKLLEIEQVAGDADVATGSHPARIGAIDGTATIWVRRP
jgi:hypothetical protein